MRSNKIADKSAITFDLGSLFEVNQAEQNELNVHQVPDDLCALLDNVSQNVHATHEIVDGVQPQADNTALEKVKKRSNIFQTSPVKKQMKLLVMQ